MDECRRFRGPPSNPNKTTANFYLGFFADQAQNAGEPQPEMSVVYVSLLLYGAMTVPTAPHVFCLMSPNRDDSAS